MFEKGLIRDDVTYVLIYDEQTDSVLAVQNEIYWSLPGGLREDGESLHQAAIREAKEETGYDVAVGQLVHLSERQLGNKHAVFFTFRGEIGGGEASTTDSEIQQIAWKTIAEAEELMPYLAPLRPLLQNSATYRIE